MLASLFSPSRRLLCLESHPALDPFALTLDPSPIILDPFALTLDPFFLPGGFDALNRCFVVPYDPASRVVIAGTRNEISQS